MKRSVGPRIEKQEKEEPSWQLRLPDGLRDPGAPGGIVPVEVTRSLLADLERLGSSHSVPLSVTLLAAYLTELHLYTDADQIPIDCRLRAQQLNGLVVRVTKTLTLKELLAILRPLWTEDRRKIGENLSMAPPRRRGVFFSAVGKPEGNHDFGLVIDLEARDPRPHLVFREGTFRPEAAASAAQHLIRCLHALLHPDTPIAELDILSDSEIALLRAWNSTRRPYRAGNTVHAVFQSHARAAPDRIAIQTESTTITYEELDRRSTEFAGGLMSAGVPRESFVATCLPRTPALVTALLGIIKAGAGYVALDHSWPEERLRQAVRDSAARGVVSTPYHCPSSLRDLLIEVDDTKGPTSAATTPSLPSVRGSSPCCLFFTSGSTGSPKGVVSPHRATLRVLVGADYAKFDASTTMLQAAPLPWDGLTLELWTPLLNGGRSMLLDEPYLTTRKLRRLVKDGLNTLWITSSLFNAFVDEDIGCFTGLTQVLTGGERLSASHVQKFLEEHPATTLVNGYGPAESCVFATTHRVRLRDVGDGDDIPIGRPVPNTTLYVLRRQGTVPRHVPTGVVGEIFVGGDGLGRYLEDEVPDSTGFLSLDLPRLGRERLYRTGDLGYLGFDGMLHFVGRADRQIKVRGHRIEPGEIERIACSRKDVGSAVIVGVGGPNEHSAQRIVLYYTSADREPIDKEDLHGWLRSRLPSFMVPASLVEMPSLPLTATGKIDVRALPQPSPSADSASRGQQALEDRPSDPQWSDDDLPIGRLMGDVLDVLPLGPDDDFFAHGGTSLSATRLCARLWRLTRSEVPVAQIFDTPTPRSLGTWIRASLLPTVDLPEPRPAGAGKPELSAAQSRFWFAEQLHPREAGNLVFIAYRIKGTVDSEALGRALGRVLRRHEALRTVYPQDEGLPHQLVLSPAEAEERLHFRAANVEDRDLDRLAEAFRIEEGGRGFDLTRDLPIRGTLFTAPTNQEQLLVLTFHHIATDAWSEVIFLDDLSRYYAALLEHQDLRIVEEPHPYRSFVQWHQTLLSSPLRRAQERYWQNALSGIHPLRLSSQSAEPSQKPVTVSQSQVERVRDLAKQESCSLFIVALASYAAALQAVGAGEDFGIAFPVSGRRHPAFDNTIGCFVNTIGVRVRSTRHLPLSRLLQGVRIGALEAMSHQDLPFNQVVSLLNPPRTRRHALFQTLFALGNRYVGDFRVRGSETVRVPLHEPISDFDIDLELWEEQGRGGLRGELQTAPGVLSTRGTENLANAFALALEGLTQHEGMLVEDIARAVS